MNGVRTGEDVKRLAACFCFRNPYANALICAFTLELPVAYGFLDPVAQWRRTMRMQSLQAHVGITCEGTVRVVPPALIGTSAAAGGRQDFAACWRQRSPRRPIPLVEITYYSALEIPVLKLEGTS